ncbi:unnamed protein product [Protopolystoma xenopodis]|uniref:Uncharacterized protein n=1 Tax=Protopolystoma xenopodis TaxID=117903 RepID=A0A448WAT2_9PLAT|nr:unnamed protein product [Protopolystoma xenopodis]
MDGATYALRISDKQDTGSCNYAALRLIRSDGVTLGRTLYGGSWTLDLKMSMSKPELLLGFNETSLFGIDLLSGSVWRAGQNNLSDDSKENLRLPVRLNGHENGVIQIRHSISSGQRPEIIVDAMKELGFIVSIVQAEAGQGVPIRIRMNKWYHGRVIGLLGNSDGEANNDIVTTNPVHPVGSSTEKSRISVGVNKHGDRKTWMSKALKYHVVDKYIESTTLSSSEEKKCRLVLDEGINYATESATIQGIIDMFSNTPKCGFLLRAPISPFAHCFDAVNVQPYLRLCNLLKDQGTYAVIQLYASACSDAKVNIPQNVPWPSANSVNFSTVPVVFIVNHDSFRTNAQMLKAIQGLSSLSKAITSGHDHLHNPIKVTFGLIGFSDSLLTTVIYGHSTKASSSWLTTASLAELDSSLERLIDNSSILCERSIQDASVTGLSGYADATELALKMVSLIEFHSPPLFVLIAGDSGCPRANLSTDHETKITNELIESQANLVFASEFNYREPPGGHRSLLGVDRYHAYSPRHPGGRRLAGIEAPRPPEDACASWALESAAWGLAWDVRTFPDEISKRLVMQAVSLSAKQTIS